MIKKDDADFKNLAEKIEKKFENIPNFLLNDDVIEVIRSYDVLKEINEDTSFCIHSEMKNDDATITVHRQYIADYYLLDGVLNPVIASYFNALPRAIDVEIKFSINQGIFLLEKQKEKHKNKEKN